MRVAAENEYMGSGLTMARDRTERALGQDKALCQAWRRLEREMEAL